MTIKIATLNNLPIISTYYQALYTQMSQLSPHIYQANIKSPMHDLHQQLSYPTHLFLIAEKQQETVGFLHAFKAQTPDNPLFIPQKFAYLSALYIQPDFRKQGFGKALVEQALIWQKNNELAYFELNVLNSNPTAQAFYQSVGFTPTYQTLRR